MNIATMVAILTSIGALCSADFDDFQWLNNNYRNNLVRVQEAIMAEYLASIFGTEKDK